MFCIFLCYLIEIDITYGLIFKKYIECKNFTGPVPLDYVAKFKEVLKLNRISPRSGLFITTSYYTPRATTIGIAFNKKHDICKVVR